MTRTPSSRRAGSGIAGFWILVLAATACTSSPDPRGPSTTAGTVSAASPEAAAAGLAILEAGGNAIDAAIAVSLALGVSEPAGSGIGGQVYMLIHPPGGEPVVINGSTLAPAATPHDATAADIVGRRATTVPSALKVLDLAWHRFGSRTVTWSELVDPAVRIAEEGFVLGPFRRHATARYARALRPDPATASILLAGDGSAPTIGTVVRRPALAATLRRIAAEGAACFYTGPLATEIDADMRRHGGWLRREDLERFPEPAVTPALRGSYRDLDVYTLPPPAGGWVVIQALNILEQADPASLRDLHQRVAWVAEALRAAHGSRSERPIPDPRQPSDALRLRLAKERAHQLVEAFGAPGGGETTHFSVVDGDGLVVSVSQSLNNYFGARVTAPGLGFLYNDYMREFETGSPGHPYALRPGALPYSSMAATILTRDGQPVLALGSPGSRRIISAVIQVIVGWVDRDLPIVEAVAAPRLHVTPEDDDLMMEMRPDDRLLLRELEERGFSVAIPLSSLHQDRLNAYFGGVHAVAFEEGAWRGAADPRRDGMAVNLGE